MLVLETPTSSSDIVLLLCLSSKLSTNWFFNANQYTTLFFPNNSYQVQCENCSPIAFLQLGRNQSQALSTTSRCLFSLISLSLPFCKSLRLLLQHCLTVLQSEGLGSHCSQNAFNLAKGCPHFIVLTEKQHHCTPSRRNP